MKILTVTIVLILSGAVCIGESDPAAPTSERYSYSTYRSEGERIVLLVDGYQVSLHQEDDYLPFPVAVGLRGKGGGITISPESFVLVGSAGHESRAVPYKELLPEYGKIEFDRELDRIHRLVLGHQFEMDHRLDSDFYARKGTVTERVHLANGTWFRDILYFPRPAVGLNGELTIRLQPDDSDEIVEVRFRIHGPGE